MRKFLLFLSAVAIAGAQVLSVYASNWIGSESDSIGNFGDVDTSINSDLQNFYDEMEDFINDDVHPDSAENFEDVHPDAAADAAADAAENFEDDFDSDGEIFNKIDIFVQDEQISNDFSALIDFPEDDYFGDIVQPYANYNVYYGAIGTTYLEYMRGFLPKLNFREHYVCARVSQYDYIFAFGEDLTWNGSFFTGFNIKVISWNTYNNGSFTHSDQSSFNLFPSSYLVYSDLSDVYPSLADTSGVSLRQILILLVIVFLCWTIDHMYQVRKIRRVK